MQMDPEYIGVGELFDNNAKYIVAKYQRSYSWKDEALTDFYTDLKDCFERRKNGQPKDHFFGGIISIIQGQQAIGYKEFEIIDGQQRVTTFTLVASALIHIYKNLKDEATALSDTINAGLIQERIDLLYSRFTQFIKQIRRDRTPFDVLTLSSADKEFYKSLVHNQTPTATRASHENLNSAYQFFIEKLKTLINIHNTITDKMDDLEIIEQTIDNDFRLMHIVTYDKSDAFRLFQVINDRGMSLTDGDLLRSRTLEMTDNDLIKQEVIESKWNAILADEPNITAKYLKWLYESYKGESPKANALYDMFLDQFFPMHTQAIITQQNINDISTKIVEIDKDINTFRKITSGQWVFPHKQPITGWDRNRLDLLVNKLGHDLAIPLLLSGIQLEHKQFSKLIQMIEKAFFRYKLICNQHVGPLKKIYHEESIKIRNSPATYNLNTLKVKLNTLITTKANDIIFTNALKTLEYKDSGGSNKTLKYFLLNVEYFFNWYHNGATGIAKCLNKSIVYDFNDTSIEHIYPRNARVTDKDTTLEPIKNSLGNLSIMDPAQNTLSGNENYISKRPAYQVSSVTHLQHLANTNAVWGTVEVSANETMIIDLALKVFKL